MKLDTKISSDWWDGREAESFFPSVYKIGDDSLEGHLDNQLLRLNERTLRECDIIEKILELPYEAKILDCPCGYGRHSFELARRGYRVTGMDLCSSFIESAEENLKHMAATAASVNKCRFISGDMRNLPDHFRNFDACINMFFSFGFFDEEGNLQVLREFHRILRPGGMLLIHTDVNPNRIKSGNYKDRFRRTLKNDSELLIEEHYNPDAKRLEGSWTIRSRDGLKTREYTVRIYEHEELREMLQNARFQKIHTIFVDGGVSDNPNSQEVIYVAKK